MRRRFVIEIVEEDTLMVKPEDFRDAISLAIGDAFRIEEDISYSVEEID